MQTHRCNPLQLGLRPRKLAALLLLGLAPLGCVVAAPVIYTAAGATPADIQVSVDQFRTDLGGVNNAAGAPAASGRREINWDGVPDTVAAPNFMKADQFRARGVIFTAPGSPVLTDTNNFLISANPTTTAVLPRFGDIDTSYTSTFTFFSGPRLFAVRESNVIGIQFFVPASPTPATVSGFGVVFTDVDLAATTLLKAYSVDGRLLLNAQPAPVANGGLSFLGVRFDDPGQRIARVEIVLGNAPLHLGNVDGTYTGVGLTDVVAMDDFIYGEPRSIDVLLTTGFQ
ncbi:MAG: hypothetical protein ABI411_15695 [Tahibacter sp.]